MKTDTFQVDSGLPHHPKIIKLKRLIGSPGCWSLICLWAYTAAHKPDGRLDLTKTEIERVAHWGGTKGKFLKALLSCNLLVQQDNHYLIHDWQLHNPYQATSKDRSDRARKAALSRWQKDSAIDKKQFTNASQSSSGSFTIASQSSWSYSSSGGSSNGLNGSSSGGSSSTLNGGLNSGSSSSLNGNSSGGSRIAEPSWNGDSFMPQALHEHESGIAQSDANALPQADAPSMNLGNAKTMPRARPIQSHRISMNSQEPSPTPPGGRGQSESVAIQPKSPEQPTGTTFAWEGDGGFPGWLSRLWGWEVPRVMQYLRKAKRDSVTAEDARAFYEDYRRELTKPQAVDWANHPNTNAYKARCAVDSYAFLLEFPSGSPERTLRASFLEWFQSQPDYPLSASQNPQEGGFSPLDIGEDDYDF